jgi:hypothetical protein
MRTMNNLDQDSLVSRARFEPSTSIQRTRYANPLNHFYFGGYLDVTSGPMPDAVFWAAYKKCVTLNSALYAFKECLCA